MAKKQIRNNSGRPLVPLLKSEIEEAQLHTQSNVQAAKWLKVSYQKYKRYAKIYGIFDRHANPLGLGISKGFGKKSTSIALRDIFANKHPKYSLVRLKRRMIARNMLEEKCGMCGFCEKRITDNKSPLMLTFKGSLQDYTRSNLWLLCYNCMFLTTGAPWAAHRYRIKSSLTSPNFKPSKQEEFTKTDYEDIDGDDDISMDNNWQEEILRDIGR